MTAPLGYHAMRMRWCRVALLGFVRRWGAYLLVGAAVIGAGGSGGLEAVRAVAAWSVLPLFYSAAEGYWVVLAVVLQSALAAMLISGMRGLLWPQRWALAERALPIARRDTLRSDLAVVLWALCPLLVLYALGTQILIERDPSWLRPARGLALAALALVVASSLGLGVATLQGLRRPRRGRPGSGLPGAPAPRLPGRALPSSAAAPARWPSVLLILPLWRGPARRTGRAIGVGLAVLALTCLLMWLRPAAASWCLVGYALLSMSVTSRVRVLAGAEFATLRRASLPLPIPQGSLRRRLDVLLLSPLLFSIPLLLASLPLTGLRPIVLTLYLAGCIACNTFEVRAASADAVAAATRWLLCVALLVALASEVLA